MTGLGASDLGAISGLMVLAYLVYDSALEAGPARVRLARGLCRALVVAAFAVLLAGQAVIGILDASLKGVPARQDTQSLAQQWNWATQWSLPKREALGIFIPGLFGYRMDMPGEGAAVPASVKGSVYWGRIGSDAAWDKYLEGDKQGPPPAGLPRFSGGGVYAGVAVVLVALWAVLQALRRKDSAFERPERPRSIGSALWGSWVLTRNLKTQQADLCRSPVGIFRQRRTCEARVWPGGCNNKSGVDGGPTWIRAL